MAGAVKPARQGVQQEPTDELVCDERHHLLAVATAVAIILVSERDASLIEPKQPAVGDGDPMGIARQIGQHGLGTCERRLGIDHPAFLADRRQVAQECPRSARCVMLPKKLSWRAS